MQRNTIWLNREGGGYCIGHASDGESVAYFAKKVDERETLEPLTFDDCLRLANSFPKEFYKRKVKVEVGSVNSSLIDELEENAFRAFIRLCEISSK